MKAEKDKFLKEDKRSVNLITDIANNIDQILQFTNETQSDNEDNKLG